MHKTGLFRRVSAFVSAVARTFPARAPKRVRVVDAETGVPVPGAVVDLHDWPSTPETPDPRHPHLIDNAYAEILVRSRHRPAIWQVRAAGYIEQRMWSGAHALPPRYAAHAGGGYDGVIHLYRLPEPQLEIWVRDGYEGPLTIHLEPAPGFGYVAGDGPNLAFAALDPRASYVQDVPGRRAWTVTASAGSAIELVVTPLLYEIQTRQLLVRDAGGALPHRDIADPPGAGRALWGEANPDDKTLQRRIRLFVGTLAAYRAYLRSAQ